MTHSARPPARSRSPRAAALLAAVLATAAVAPSAQANPYAENLTLRLLPGWELPDGRQIAGLDVRLAEGWKTYWRAPGAAGIPPAFDWSGSENLSAVQVMFPRPDVFDQGGMTSIGYHDRVILPVVLTPRDPNRAIALEGRVSLGICSDVCVPVEVELSGDPAAPEGARRDPAIASALAARPYSESEGKVARVACAVAPAPNGLSLSVDIQMPDAGGPETVVFETPDPQVWADLDTGTRTGGRLSARTELMHASGGPFALDRSQLRITVLGRDRAVEIRGCD